MGMILLDEISLSMELRYLQNLPKYAHGWKHATPFLFNAAEQLAVRT